MQAIFRFNGSEEFEVWTDHVGVYVTKRHCFPLSAGSDPQDPSPEEKFEEKTFGFSKSQARSIASAMMQAAAEL